ncbi:selenoprotein L [Syngnathus typhle]
MEEDVIPEESLTTALKQLVSLGNVLLQQAKKDAEVSMEDFVPYKIATLLGLIAAGAEFYRSIGVKKKSEAEAAWQKLYGRAPVREQVEELLQLQSEWDSFLEYVDQSLQSSCAPVKPGGETVDIFSPETLLTDGRSGKSVTLDHYRSPGQKLLLVLIRHYG